MVWQLQGEIRGNGIRQLLESASMTVGSGASNQFRLQEPTVSTHHCVLELRGDQVVVRDLNSTNGTFVDGTRVRDEALLVAGSVLTIGRVDLQLAAVDDGDLEPAVEFSVPVPAPEPVATSEEWNASTLGMRPIDSLVLKLIPQLLRSVQKGATPLEVAQDAGGIVARALPIRSLELRDSQGAVLFRSGPEDSLNGPEARPTPTFQAENADFVATVQCDNSWLERWLLPILESVTSLLDLASRASISAPQASSSQRFEGESQGFQGESKRFEEKSHSLQNQSPLPYPSPSP